MARKATFRQPLHEAVEDIGLGDVGGGDIDGQPNMSQIIRPGRGDLQHALLNMRRRSEEHTSELQSLMRISYAVFCLTKQIKPQKRHTYAFIYRHNSKYTNQLS